MSQIIYKRPLWEGRLMMGEFGSLKNGGQGEYRTLKQAAEERGLKVLAQRLFKLNGRTVEEVVVQPTPTAEEFRHYSPSEKWRGEVVWAMSCEDKQVLEILKRGDDYPLMAARCSFLVLKNVIPEGCCPPDNVLDQVRKAIAANFCLYHKILT